jgi:hypothetical protein
MNDEPAMNGLITHHGLNVLFKRAAMKARLHITEGLGSRPKRFFW